MKNPPAKNLKNPYYLLFFLFVTVFAPGCASIVHGTTQEIPITSNPPGAKVDINGSEQRTTPCTVALKRKKDHLLTFTMDGYDSQTVSIKHTMSGAVAGNIIAGGLIGWGIDATSGGQYKLVPNTISVTLNPDESLQKVQPLDAAPAKRTLSERQMETDKLKSDGWVPVEENIKLPEKLISEESGSN
jgi:hypothetical protein